MNSNYAKLDRVNYVYSIDPIYPYQRCYKHIAMGVADDLFVHRHLHDGMEGIFSGCITLFHGRLKEHMTASMEYHLQSQAYKRAKKLIFERIAKLFRDEDTEYARDMTFKAELILATHFSRKKRDKKSDGECVP